MAAIKKPKIPPKGQPGTLVADVHVRRGEFSLDAGFELASGSTMAILGPNGSGKTTLLHALAGITPIEAGRIEIGSRVLSDPRARIRVPIAGRRIGILTQQAHLFPHMNALQNVAFGPANTGIGRRASRKKAWEWLERVDMAGHANLRPHALSGGQRQRVALARALAAEPDLLLLDEPMAALDVRAVPQLRELLKQQIAASGASAIVVTHNLLDGLVLAESALVLDGGRVVEQATLPALVAHPRSEFAAALAGVSMIRGKLISTSPAAVATSWGELFLDRVPEGAGLEEEILVRVQARHIRLAPVAESEGAAGMREGSRLRARVRWFEETEGGIRVRLEPATGASGSAESLLALVPLAQVNLAWLHPGAEVEAALLPEHMQAERAMATGAGAVSNQNLA